MLKRPKPYFWMTLSVWLDLKIIIELNGKEETGYLKTAKNQSGDFYLYDNLYRGDKLMSGKTDEVKSARLSFWNFLFKDNLTNKSFKMGKRSISILGVSNCFIPNGGNIPYLVIPYHMVLINPKISGVVKKVLRAKRRMVIKKRRREVNY